MSHIFQMTYDRDLGGKVPEGPKHGKVDPTGNPHVGGNTWAGGSGESVFMFAWFLLIYLSRNLKYSSSSWSPHYPG